MVDYTCYGNLIDAFVYQTNLIKTSTKL